MGGGKDGVCEAIARAKHGIITRAEAFAAGLSPAEIEWRVRSRRWRPLHRGIYWICAAAGLDELTRLHAATLATGGVAWADSAARLWKMDAFSEPDNGALVQLASARDSRLVADGCVVVHHPWLTPEMLTTRDGIPVAQPAWTLFGLGATATRDDVECALDFCLRKRWTSWSELEEILKARGTSGQRGAAALQELLDLRTQRQWTDSMLETRTLQLIRHFGLPTPVLQFPVKLRDRTVHADFGFPDHSVLIETIGREAHFSELWQLTRDCNRSNSLALERQYTVLSFTWHQVTREPEQVAERIRQALGIPTQTPFRYQERPGGRPILYPPLR